MIPCEKCIVLAACKTKRRIECETLYEIMKRQVIMKTNSSGQVRKTLRKELSKMFPNSIEITIAPNGNQRLIFKGYRDE